MKNHSKIASSGLRVGKQPQPQKHRNSEQIGSFISEGSNQTNQKESFYEKLGSLIGLDINDPVEKIAFDRVRKLEQNPKIVIFDSRINGLTQRGLVMEQDNETKPIIQKKPKLTKEMEVAQN